MSKTPSISSLGFTTSGLPARQQYEAWRGWHDRTFDGAPSTPAAHGFLAESKIFRTDGLALVRISTPAMRVKRTKALIRQNPVDRWVVTLGSPTTLTSGNTTFEAPARSPFILSLADEMVSERGPGERLQLYLSRDSFRDLAPVLDVARGAVVSGPLGTLLAEYLELLNRNLRQIDVAEAGRFRDAVGAMIAACVSPSPDRAAAAKPQLDLGRLENVRRAVRRELRSPLLGPDRLCHLLGMSRSALYRLMERQGGVTRYIRRQRLLESRATLSDPGCDASVAAIAEEFCFADASDFSRAFKREFGASPSEVRAHAKAGLSPPVASVARAGRSGSTFNDFIQAL